MPNIMSLDKCFKKLHLVKVGAFVTAQASKFAFLSVIGLKDEKMLRKQTYVKTEAYILYSGVF